MVNYKLEDCDTTMNKPRYLKNTPISFCSLFGAFPNVNCRRFQIIHLWSKKSAIINTKWEFYRSANIVVKCQIENRHFRRSKSLSSLCPDKHHNGIIISKKRDVNKNCLINVANGTISSFVLRQFSEGYSGHSFQTSVSLVTKFFRFLRDHQISSRLKK